MGVMGDGLFEVFISSLNMLALLMSILCMVRDVIKAADGAGKAADGPCMVRAIHVISRVLNPSRVYAVVGLNE